MCAYDGEKIVFLQKGAGGRIREEVGATPNVVMDKVFAGLLLTKLFERVGPEYVAHKTMRGGLTEAVDLHHLI